MCEDVPIQAALQAVQTTSGSDILTWILAAVGIIVAALGVMFTIASVILGVMAFRGYKEWKEAVVTGASRAAKEAVEAAIAKYPNPEAFTRQLKEEMFALMSAEPVASISTLETSKVKVDLGVIGEPQAITSEDTEKPVGEPYPGEGKEVKEDAGTQAGPAKADDPKPAEPEDRPPDGGGPPVSKEPAC